MLRSGDCGVTSHGSFPLYYIAIRAAGARLLEIPLREYAMISTQSPAICRRTRSLYTWRIRTIPPGRCSPRMNSIHSSPRAANCFGGGGRSLLRIRGARGLFALASPWRASGPTSSFCGRFPKCTVWPACASATALVRRTCSREMNKLRGPFNTSGVAQAAALAALDDVEHVRRRWIRIAQDSRNDAGLKRAGNSSVPSVANFVLAGVRPRHGTVSEELLSRGVIVRPMRWMGFPRPFAYPSERTKKTKSS